MKKIKILLPTLLTAATAATTLGFITSCSSNYNSIKMVDVLDLLQNGYERKTEGFGQVTVSESTPRKWYFTQVAKNKAILRDDILVDTFPKPDVNMTSNDVTPSYTGQVGLQITQVDSNPIDQRLGCDIQFNGSIADLWLPKVKGLIPGGYLYATLNTRISMNKIAMNIQKFGPKYKMYPDYYEGSQIPPIQKHISVPDLIQDDKWSISWSIQWKGGFSDTPGGDITIETHELKMYHLDCFWVSNQHREDQEGTVAWFDFIFSKAHKNLESMEYVTFEK